MYNGYTESAEQIARRKARILKGYRRSGSVDKPAKRSKKSGGRKPSGSLGGDNA
jgi:hypothetical protein